MTAKSNAREGDGVGAALDALDVALIEWSYDMKDQAFSALNEAVAKVRDAYHAIQAQQGAESVASTPSSRWAANGEPDPHGTQYDCERAALAHGDMTDDELANAVFLCDHRRSFDSIGLVMAAKDRIRWLSRKLAATGAPR